MDKIVPQRCNATGATPLDSSGEHQVLEDGHAYSTVDVMQQQVIIASDNPAYSKGFMHSQQPAQQCGDHGHSTIELSQEQEMVTYGPHAHEAVPLKQAATAK